MPAPRTLTIVSAAPHHVWEGQVWSHEPYVREIDVWGHLFERVVIVGPSEATPPTRDCIAFEAPSIELRPVPPTGGDGLIAKARQLALLPLLVWRVCRALTETDAAHVRAPGNMAILGVFLAPLLRRRLVAKYAGQWNGFDGEKWTVRLQRAVLRSPWWHGPVTVYGDWPDQPHHVVPFFTSVLTEAQVRRARALRRPARRQGRLRLLFVGRLSGPKNVDTVLRAVAELAGEGVDIRCTIVGDGAERDRLKGVAAAEGIEEVVTFAGALGLDEVLDQYEQADTLALVSQSEGWPKAIAEAMSFGVVCVGSDGGMVPQMLGEGRGHTVPPGDHVALAEVLRRIADDPAEADATGHRAAAWGQRHSLDELESAISALLDDWWQVPIGAGAPRTSVLHVTDTLDAGGAERMAVNLVNGLSRERFRPLLCITRRRGALASETRSDIPTLALRRRGRLSDPVAILRLARFLRRERIDVVHAHGTSVFISAAACALVPRTRLVWHDHLGPDPASRSPRTWLYRLAAREVDHVIAVSRLLADWDERVLGFGPQQLTTIPNFVTPPPPGTVAPADLPGTAGTRVACVANLRPQKDHLTLVEAMARVVEDVPSAHALLLGAFVDADVTRSVEQAISRNGLVDHVTLLGPRADVASVLSGSSVGALSSRSEGFPLALLEYGTQGLPVVATAVGECPNILDHGAAGVLVPPGDPEALADAITTLLQDPIGAARLGAALRARVDGRYGPSAVVEQVEEVYDAVTGARRPRRAPSRTAS